jgi:flagellar basal body-associated protein FliL
MNQIQDADHDTQNKRTLYGVALLVTALLIILSRVLAVLWHGYKESHSYRPSKVNREIVCRT